MQVDLKKLLDLIADVHEELQLEVNQSVMKNDHGQGVHALGGMGALERLERKLKLQLGLWERPEDLEVDGKVQRIESLPPRPPRTVRAK